MPSLSRLPKDIQLIIDEMLHPIDKMMIRITCRTKHDITVGIEDAKYILSNRQFTQFEYLRDQINHNIHRRRLILIAIHSGIPAIEYLRITVDEIKGYHISLEECITLPVAKYLHSRGLDHDHNFCGAYNIAKRGNIELYDWYCRTFDIKEYFCFAHHNISPYMLDHIINNGHLPIEMLTDKYVRSVGLLNVITKHGITMPHDKLVTRAIKTCDHGLYIAAGLGNVDIGGRLINLLEQHHKSKYMSLLNVVFLHTNMGDIPERVWDYLMIHDLHNISYFDTLLTEKQECWECNSLIYCVLMHGDLQLCRWLFSKYTLNDTQKQRIIDICQKWPESASLSMNYMTI
jgi:hypothetical protein